MAEFNIEDWFKIRGTEETYQVERTESDEVVVYLDDRGMELTVSTEYLVKVPNPYPRLAALAERESVFAPEPNPTFNELMQKALKEFPDAYVEEMYGEIVIRTGFKAVRDLDAPLEKLEPEG